MTSTSGREILFLPRQGFHADDAGPFYCGDSIAIEGMLGLFPELRDAVEVRRIDFQRPRAELVDRLGEANQSLPVLILPDNSPEPEEAFRSTIGGVKFLDDEAAIRAYLSRRHGAPRQK